MPIASMLEADKPFMFATNTASNEGVPTFSRTSSYQPPPPQSNTPPPSTTSGPPSSSYYHPHEQQQQQQHQQHNHTHSHQHHHHSAPVIQDDDHFLYHHSHHPHPHQVPPPPVTFGRPPPPMEQDGGFPYRSSSTSSTHIASMYQQRRMPQQQQQQQQRPHLHHHSTQYHVHNRIHRPPIPPQSVMDEHYRVSTSAAAAAAAAAAQTAAAQAQAAATPTPPSVLPLTTSATSSSVARPPSGHAPATNSSSAAASTLASGLYDAEDSDAWLLEGNYEADSRRQKRKKDFGGRLEKINTDFMENKERIYSEKLSAIQQEIKQVHENTHVGLLEGIEELKRTREKRIYDGRLLRAYREQVIDSQFNQERVLAEDECLAEKQEMRGKLFAALEEKRRKLKEDKDNCELSYDTLLESQSRLMKRNLRRRGMEHSDSKSVKRKQTSSPSLVFRLKDDDLQSDLDAMHIDCAPLLSKKLATASKKK